MDKSAESVDYMVNCRAFEPDSKFIFLKSIFIIARAQGFSPALLLSEHEL